MISDVAFLGPTIGEHTLKALPIAVLNCFFFRIHPMIRANCNNPAALSDQVTDKRMAFPHIG